MTTIIGATKEYKEWSQEIIAYIEKVKQLTSSDTKPTQQIIDNVISIEADAQRCINQIEHEYNGLPPNTKKELASDLNNLKLCHKQMTAYLSKWKEEQGILDNEENKIMDDCINVSEKIMEHTKGTMGTLQEHTTGLVNINDDLTDMRGDIKGSKSNVRSIQKTEFANKIILLMIAAVLFVFVVFYGLKKLSII